LLKAGVLYGQGQIVWLRRGAINRRPESKDRKSGKKREYRWKVARGAAIRAPAK